MVSKTIQKSLIGISLAFSIASFPMQSIADKNPLYPAKFLKEISSNSKPFELNSKQLRERLQTFLSPEVSPLEHLVLKLEGNYPGVDINKIYSFYAKNGKLYTGPNSVQWIDSSYENGEHKASELISFSVVAGTPEDNDWTLAYGYPESVKTFSKPASGILVTSTIFSKHPIKTNFLPYNPMFARIQFMEFENEANIVVIWTGDSILGKKDEISYYNKEIPDDCMKLLQSHEEMIAFFATERQIQKPVDEPRLKHEPAPSGIPADVWESASIQNGF